MDCWLSEQQMEPQALVGWLQMGFEKLEPFQMAQVGSLALFVLLA
jgi:hypothetical protein